MLVLTNCEVGRDSGWKLLSLGWLLLYWICILERLGWEALWLSVYCWRILCSLILWGTPFSIKGFWYTFCSWIGLTWLTIKGTAFWLVTWWVLGEWKIMDLVWCGL